MANQSYTLYHNNYSICSVMVRYSIALRGEPRSPEAEMRIHEREINIFRQEQLSEDFLTKINAKGQVPVLAPPSPAKPIADSVNITHYIAKAYPALIPDSHRAQIIDLLNELHDLNFFSLSFTGKHFVNNGAIGAIQNRLDDDNISEAYRKALEYKLEVQHSEKGAGLQDDVVATMTTRADVLMKKCDSLLRQPEDKNKWMLGLPHPTALDAHLICFIARMRDVNRKDLIPSNLGAYADRAMATEAWNAVMQGRGTMPQMK